MNVSALIIGDRCPRNQEIQMNKIIVCVVGDSFDVFKHDVHPELEGNRYHLGEIHNVVLRYVTHSYTTGKG